MHCANVAVVTSWYKEKHEINLFFFVWPVKIEAGEELWLDYGHASVLTHCLTSLAKGRSDADLTLHSNAGCILPLCKDC